MTLAQTAPSQTIDLDDMGRRARHAFRLSSRTPTDTRNAALLVLADHLQAAADAIRTANQTDIQLGRQNGLTEALIDRLTLTDKRIDGLLADLRALAEMPDPVGTTYDERTLPNGLRIHRRRVPLGVLGVIYESRPNVTVDVAALAIKTGNTAILRGGKETIHSNRALMQIIHATLAEADLPVDMVQFIDSPDRALVGEMLRLNEHIDVIVPRGGNGLHTFCRKTANIPVITGGIGICHLYVDTSADLDAALPVIYNAKVQRPSVCNSLDTLLVERSIAPDFLPRVVQHLHPAGVTFRAAPRAAALLDHPAVTPAGPDDFDTEWLSLVLGLQVVDDLDAAIDHITTHTTAHSDGILSQTPEHIEQFINQVDSAGVFVNASTRFNDGGQLGLGAEVAVSTQRLHSRGPMGLPELTTYKWVIVGDYTVRG